jgi:2-polyprenyl-3-methyl-5-hydroxy-6-metoxy-1,4-benzoquinol methylase
MLVENAGIICNSVSRCEVCGGDGRLLYSALADTLFDAPGRWNLVRCTNISCGLIWSDPRPRPDQITKLYERYYTHQTTAAAEDVDSYKSRPLVRMIKQLLALIFFWRAPAFLSDNHHLQNMKPGRLLDVGCGDGDFLAKATRDGWLAHGVDFDAKAIEAANKLDGVSAQVGDLTECEFPSHSFDAITMNNVIEHVWNPLETIKECNRLLRPGGRLVMITPNSDSAGHAIFKQDWRGLEPPRHLFIYNCASLVRLAKLAGFAKVLCFTSSGGNTGMLMLQVSKEATERNGRSIPTVDFAKTIRRETIGAIFGGTRGEWCVLVCEAPTH